MKTELELKTLNICAGCGKIEDEESAGLACCPEYKPITSRWVSLDSLVARDAKIRGEIDIEIRNTTKILEKASREQKTGDNEIYLTMVGRLGGLRFGRKRLLLEDSK